jgi:hypothetical protein
MVPMNVQQLCEEAHKLTELEKNELISRLLDDLGKPGYDVSDDEVIQRVEEMKSGEVEDISEDDLKSGLKYL